MPTPTPEQLAIREAASSQSAPLVVKARAGTGKTHTILTEVLPVLNGEVLLLAYNKSIQQELQRRLPPGASFTTTVATVHSFGLSQLRSSGGKFTVESGKLRFLWKRILASKRSFRDNFDEKLTGQGLIPKLVSYAKNAGFGIPILMDNLRFPHLDDFEAWELLISHFNLDTELESANLSPGAAITMAIHLLSESNRQDTVLDFDDMIYLPLLWRIPIRQFSHVVIDEAQDISPTRLTLAWLASRAKGRIIAVGDDRQAIYGFTGAMADSLDRIINLTAAKVLPLTICWRCDDAILAQARQLVPDIRTRPAAPLGLVDSQTIDDWLAHPDAIPLGSAILCRLNRPNVAVALALLRAGRPAQIEGRDLGRNLLAHIKKAEPLYATADLDTLLGSLEAYTTINVSSFLAKNRPTQAALFRDETDAATLLLERAAEEEPASNPFPAVENLIARLFADNVPASSRITLSSIHKAKGREWPRVYALGRSDYQPFFKAESEWELLQEDNLTYVQTTRAQHHLTSITGVQAWLKRRESSANVEEE